ncbi:GNAT family N-acetyltransferase [uncultured Paraglaciecola sp.]|uniref:tRNA(Met) cytidine acetyltransferase TmcA n=1 Tax=uncultured Paraglaciecola sp. TaxID=1765024 RepID=UPI0030D98C40
MNLPEQLNQWLKQRHSKLCHRQLLVITGQEAWATETASTLLREKDQQKILWVGNSQVEYDNISVKNYRSKLGHEYDWVILNCFSGFRANAAMALSGTITANGLMVLLCPELSQWPYYADPEQLNRISYGYQQKDTQSFFIQHLVDAFRGDSAVAILSANQFAAKISFVEDSLDKKKYDEQEMAVKKICQVAQGHRNRPLVLTADRGRGKSSALGIAAARLMQTSKKTIYLTAPHINTVEQVFVHNQRLLPDALTTSNSVTYQSSSLTFKPIDKLLEDESPPDLLLVDEASAIPVHILCKLAKTFPRIVFSSTVHGYEGSGRGFEMRFIKQLSLLKPNFKRIHLSQPIRWYKQDTLEQFWLNTLFHTEPQSHKDIEPVSETISCRYISKSELLSNKTLLADIFGLLIDAHYQTSQDDLQRLLDAPEIKCFVMTRGTTLLGVAQIIEEGGKDFTELAENIADCSRRVKGHLVAQNITSTYNIPSYLLASQWRISRIAIIPEHQCKGLGKQLINFVEQQAKQHQISFLTASFGCNTNILKFWNKSEFLLAKLSAKPEISSGEHSGICIKPLTNDRLEMLTAIHIEFYQELLYQLDKNFQNVSEDMLVQILRFKPTSTGGSCLNVLLLRQFAFGKRAYSSCKRLLKEYLIVNPASLSKLATPDQKLLVAALIQNKTDKELCKNFSLSGKKQIEQALKYNFAKILLEKA